MRAGLRQLKNEKVLKINTSLCGCLEIERQQKKESERKRVGLVRGEQKKKKGKLMEKGRSGIKEGRKERCRQEGRAETVFGEVEKVIS